MSRIGTCNMTGFAWLISVLTPLTIFSIVTRQLEYLAGTGNVLKIQNLLHICSEHYEEKETTEKKEPKESDSREKDAKGKPKETAPKETKTEEPKPKLDGSHQGVAVLGISLIAMGEEIGAQMALRTFRHLVSFR